jgi:hypothetical protein
MLRRSEFVFILLFFISFSFAFSADIDTNINGADSNFVFETDSGSSSGLDVNDIELPPHVSNDYADLYSVVSGEFLILDSFGEETDRDLDLVFNISSSVDENNTISFQWDNSIFDGYQVTLKDYGNNPARGSVWSSVDMDSSDSYTSSNIYSERYYGIEVDYDETGPYCGDGICNDGETYITCPADCSAPNPPSGGGGGGGAALVDENVIVSLSELNFNLVLGTTKEFVVNVSNVAEVVKTVSVSSENLGDILMAVDSFQLQPGETKELVLKFVSPSEVGSYSVIVYVGGNPIVTTVNVRSKELLFDAMIVVPDSFKEISKGQGLEAQVTLLPMGEKDDRVDVTLNYLIKDFAGNIYLIESETILVDSEKNFKKEFNTGSLVGGNYVVALELVYPGGVATSSSHFSVLDRRYVFVDELIILGVLILLIVLVLIIWRVSIILNRRKNAAP